MTPRPVLEGVMPSEAVGALRLPFFQGHADARASWDVWRLGPWILPRSPAGQYLLPLPGPTPPRQCVLLLPSAGLLPAKIQVGMRLGVSRPRGQVALKSQRAGLLPHQRLDLLF